MKNDVVEIKDVKYKSKYLDETFYIVNHYKQLVNNPQKKIIPYARERIYIILGISAFIIITLLIFNIGLAFNCFFIGFLFLAIIVYLKDIFLAHKYISSRSKREANAILIIDDEKIVFTNNNDHITYECKWEDIKFILVSKYSISFIPISNENVRFLISVPIDYKNACFELFEKYKKMELVTENKNVK